MPASAGLTNYDPGSGGRELGGDERNLKMKIEKICLYRMRVPLKQPYKIATAVMKDFDMTIVVIRTGGKEGIGEAMAGVPGYFWETPEETWNFALSRSPALLGQESGAARGHLLSFKQKHPCAVTPFLSALETAAGSPVLAPPSRRQEVPLVGILQAADRVGAEKEVSEFLAAGYDTLKIKVGFDPLQDLAKVKAAQEAIQGRALIRIDANQGYGFSQAETFVRGLDPQGIEFFEQPLKEGEWEAMAALSKFSSVPLGLDESIYGMESVEKARSLQCCRFVKFKLMKVASAEILAQNIKKCEEYGFGVVLGNGAAGEINCYLEALAAARTTGRAGEMNGFFKQVDSILSSPIPASGAKILLDPSYSPVLDPGKISRYAVAQAVFE
jgi:L-alanine-DL-glutamate epimerase-like enolase superfamily enzyme